MLGPGELGVWNDSSCKHDLVSTCPFDCFLPRGQKRYEQFGKYVWCGLSEGPWNPQNVQDMGTEGSVHRHGQCSLLCSLLAGSHMPYSHSREIIIWAYLCAVCFVLY